MLCVKKEFLLEYTEDSLSINAKKSKIYWLILRLVVNTKDDEALRRIINFPARGIGNTTMDKILLAADHYKVGLFDIVENYRKIHIHLHYGY